MTDDELDLDLHAALDDLLRPLPALGALPARTLARGRRRRRLKVGALSGAAGLAVLGVALVGLPGGGGQDRVLPPASTPSALPSTLPSTLPSAVPSASPSAAAAATVVLAADGLERSGPGGGALPFGAPSSEVRAALDDLLGAAESFEVDCGATTVAYGDLTLYLRGDALVGWTTAVPRLATAAGVRVGLTLAELEALDPATSLQPGPDLTQFTAGGVAGFLDGDQPSSTVTNVYAGDVCLAT